ncbi:MAG TPA: SMC family ATPase [Rhodothermales bacterium]|nr:SMC family ATPase [Rhodothermales bacterium]
MVPVELRLTNFLSYGTAAPPLDFEQFHVACLSGRNGQGKSALLDAMTWALWGEARKSSGSHKPDDELIRVGTRRMHVDFAFDVEGDRYRVTRSYTRSATGKTNRTDIEFLVYEPGNDAYRPLTGGSVRETQERIDAAIGLDYDTFINSAFLLQGRSDEFTKKKPNERKEILSRILNLGRYDRLADIARDREREAADRLQQFESEIDRLTQSVEQEPKWISARDELQETVRTKQAEIAELRKQERKLTERRLALDARKREAETAEQSLQALTRRLEQHRQDEQRLRGRIAEADELVGRREQIERDYDRYQALQQERDDLDSKSHIYRGFEKQIEQREAELRDRKVEWEKRLHAAEVELRANRTALTECETALVEEPAARRSLQHAREAQRRLDEMNTVLQARKRVEDEVAAVERELLALRESLTGEIRALQEQNDQALASLPSIEQLEADRGKLSEALCERNLLQQKLDETKGRGQELGESIKECEGELSARRSAVAKLQDNFNRFLDAREEGQCPTCGTRLSSERRAEVEVHYQESVSQLEREIDERTAAAGNHKRERDALREAYKRLQQQFEGYESVPERLAKTEERIGCYHDDLAAVEARKKRIAERTAVVEEKRFGQEYRARWRQLQEELKRLPFDEPAFEQTRLDAAQAPRYEDQLRHLEQVAGRRDQLAQAVSRGEQQVNTLRAQLEDGSVLGSVRDAIAGLREQLAAVGFDAGRLERVRTEIKDLSQAGARMKDLLNAQQNILEWKEQLTRIARDLQQTSGERDALTQKLSQIQIELTGRSAVEAERDTVLKNLKGEEDALHVLQVNLGEFTARLEQAARDRGTLALRRTEFAETGHQRAIYKHLRAAFGRQGIPSLIIEETLPELEERANELLDRLTDGKMHVKLETLKDKKTGGTKETLDIIITDELGAARAYETFSGGEAFRVNFALRIALSQLLAERSGVRVRTLFIDEGFGTQDTQGIQNLVEAIQTIQEDFDKILVITHLEELKEAFPVRIEVEKDPVEGSTFEIHGI